MKTTSTRFQAIAIAVPALVAGLFAAPALAGTMQSVGHDFIHRSIAKDRQYDSVVRLDINNGSSTAGNPSGQFIASGVVIGSRYLLTAAHNIDNANQISTVIRGKTYRGSRWVAHVGNYNWDFTDVVRDQKADDFKPFPDMLSRSFQFGNDIAIIELSQRIPNAKNIRAKLSKNVSQANGRTGTIVGFGTAGDGTGITTPGDGTAANFGTKRAGHNKIDILNRNIGGSLGVDFDVDPSNPIFSSLSNPKFNPFSGRVDEISNNDIPISGEYMPSIGDSGGGLFVNGDVLAGITSWTSRNNSEYFSQAYFTTVAKHRGWIRANIQALKGLRDFRGNLKVREEFEAEVPDGMGGTTTETRYRRVSDFGATNFSLLEERGDDPGDVFGIIVEDPGSFSGRLNGATPLPEPTSLTLLGLGGLAVLRRTRH